MSDAQVRLANLASRGRSRRDDPTIDAEARLVGVEMDLARLITTLQDALPGGPPAGGAQGKVTVEVLPEGRLTPVDLERCQTFVSRPDLVQVSAAVEWIGALLAHIDSLEDR